jgi:hypothetical protein
MKPTSINGTLSAEPPLPNDFKKITKHRILQKWKTKWYNCDMGRLTKLIDSIFPDVAEKPWFHEFQEKRGVINTILRIITGHCSIRSLLYRFQAPNTS